MKDLYYSSGVVYECSKIQLEQLTWGIVINGTQYEKPEKAYGHINTLLISVGLEPLSTHHKI